MNAIKDMEETVQANKEAASSINIQELMKSKNITGYTMIPDSKGVFHLDKDHPSYQRWIEE